MRHDAAVLGVLPAAEGGGGGVHDDDLGVFVHVDRVVPAASIGMVAGALEVAGGGVEHGGIVGRLTAEALYGEDNENTAAQEKYC